MFAHKYIYYTQSVSPRPSQSFYDFFSFLFFTALARQQHLDKYDNVSLST